MDDPQVTQITTHTINILRVAEGHRQAAVQRLTELQGEITTLLEKSEKLSPNRLNRLKALQEQTDESITQAYQDISGKHQSDLKKLAKVEATMAQKMVNTKIGVDVVTVAIPEKLLEAVVDGPHIFGNSAKDWWAGQAADLQAKFKAGMQQGVLLGETVDQLAARVRGTKDNAYKDGMMEAKRREAQALVRSSAISIANEARLRQFEEMGDIVKGIQWIATLDTRTTPQCRALDGKMWRLPDYQPVGHDKAWPGPTAHWNCRSTQIAVLRSWEELSGKKLPSIDDETLEKRVQESLAAEGWSAEKISKAKAKARASMDGQVSDSVDFEAWLRLQPDSRVEAILGPGRMALWKDGKLTVSEMTDQTNRPLTLEQLEATIAKGTPAPETLGVQFLPIVSESATLSAKTEAELNKVASAEIEEIEEAAQPEAEPEPTPPDNSAETIAAILASPAGQTLKAKWIQKIQKENPEMAPKDVLANATQQALLEQASKSKAAALSVAKKKLLAGQELTPALKKTVAELTPEEAAAFNEAVADAKAKVAAEQAKNAAELALKKAQAFKSVSDAVAFGDQDAIGKIPKEQLDLLSGEEYGDAIAGGEALKKANEQKAAELAAAKTAILAKVKAAAAKGEPAYLPDDELALISMQEQQDAIKAGKDEADALEALMKQAADQATAKAAVLAKAKDAGLAGKFPDLTEAEADLVTISEVQDAINEGKALATATANPPPLDYTVDLITPQKQSNALKQLFDENQGATSSAFDNIETAIMNSPAAMLLTDSVSGKIIGGVGYQPPAKGGILEISNIGSLQPGAGSALVKELAKKYPDQAIVVFDPYTSTIPFWTKLGFEQKTASSAMVLSAAKVKALAKAAAPAPDAQGPTPPPAPTPKTAKKPKAGIAKTKEHAIEKLMWGAQAGKPLPKILKPAEIALIPAAELTDVLTAAKALQKGQPAPTPTQAAPAPPPTVTARQAPAKHPDSAIIPPTPPERRPTEFPPTASEVSSLKVVKRLGGSTGAELVEYKGKQYVRKKGASVDHVRGEFIADRVYEALGLDVPQGALYEDGDNVWKLTEFREGKELGKLTGKELEAATKAFRQGFVVDALLGNWDVLGAGKDNVLWDGKSLIRIDNGGSLNFRAMGTPKTPAEWNGIPREIFTMRDRATAPQVAALMGNVDLHDLAPTLKALRPEALDLVEMPEPTRQILKERVRHLRDLGYRAGEFAENSFNPAYTEIHAKAMYDIRERRTDLNLLGETTISGTIIKDAATGRAFGNLRSQGGAQQRPAAAMLPGDTFGPTIQDAFKTINHKLKSDATNYNQAKLTAAFATKPALKDMLKNGTAEQKIMAKGYLDALDMIDKKVDAANKGDFSALPILEIYKPKAAPAKAPAPTTSVVDDLHKMLQDQGVPASAIDLHKQWNKGQGINSWSGHTLVAKYWMSQIARKAPQDHHYWDGNNIKRQFSDAKDAWDDAVRQYGQENVEKVFAAHHALMMEQLERVETDYVDRENRMVLLHRTESEATLKANGVDTKKLKKGDVFGLRLGGTESHSMNKATYVFGKYLTAKMVPFSRVLYNHWFEPTAGSGGSGFLGDGENEWAADASGIPAVLLDDVMYSQNIIKPGSGKADWIKAGVPDYTDEFKVGKIK